MIEIFVLAMLISNCSRQCVLKLQGYADKRRGSSSHNRQLLMENNSNSNSKDIANNRQLSNLNINSSSSQLTERNEDRSLLGQFLNCPPCKKVTKKHKDKIVSLSLNENRKCRCCCCSSSRKNPNEIGKTVKRIYIGNIKQLNSLIKLKKPIKFKKNSMVYRIGKGEKSP